MCSLDLSRVGQLPVRSRLCKGIGRDVGRVLARPRCGSGRGRDRGKLEPDGNLLAHNGWNAIAEGRGMLGCLSVW